jgi:PIN domain nuclease of toxin-antitoxin system
MKVLVDTHVLLWSFIEPERLSAEATELLIDRNVERYFSAASCWEIGIKHGKGMLDLPDKPTRCVPQAMAEAGLIPLSIRVSDALAVSELPRLHEDPFDRLLIVQAKENGMYIMSRDSIFGSYDVDLIEI